MSLNSPPSAPSPRADSHSTSTFSLNPHEFEALGAGIGIGEFRKKTLLTPLTYPHEIPQAQDPKTSTNPETSFQTPSPESHHNLEPSPTPIKSKDKKRTSSWKKHLKTLRTKLLNLKRSVSSLTRRISALPPKTSTTETLHDVWQNPPSSTKESSSELEKKRRYGTLLRDHMVDYFSAILIFSATIVGVLMAEGTVSMKDITTALSQIGGVYILIFSYGFLLMMYPLTWILGVPRVSQLIWRKKS